MKKTFTVCCLLLAFFGISLTGCQDNDKSTGRQIGEAGRDVTDEVKKASKSVAEGSKSAWDKTKESTSGFIDDVKEGYQETHQDEKK